MSTRATSVFLFFGILTGLITACLGLETRQSNHLGWALLFAGAGFTTIGSLSLGVLFLQTSAAERHADRTLWLPCFAALVISLITPIEYLYLPSVHPRSDHAGYRVDSLCRWIGLLRPLTAIRRSMARP